MPPFEPPKVLSEIRSRMWKDYKKQESDVDDGVYGSCADMEIMIMDYNGDCWLLTILFGPISGPGSKGGSMRD